MGKAKKANSVRLIVTVPEGLRKEFLSCVDAALERRESSTENKSTVKIVGEDGPDLPACHHRRVALPFVNQGDARIWEAVGCPDCGELLHMPLYGP